MENLALSVSKSITDFLEQNEKRFTTQHSQQEQHDQLLLKLQSKVEELDNKCNELVTENKTLKDEVQTLKQREDATSREMITTNSTLEKMQKSVDECREWVSLITALTGQCQTLNEARETTEKVIKNISKNHMTLNKMLERQQRQLDSVANQAAAAAAATASMNTPHYNFLRTPVRSPSASSFSNVNIGGHNPLGRHTHQATNNNNHHRLNHQREDYEGPTDVNDQISDVSECADRLYTEVKVLDELQRSFGRNSSICSYDQ